MPGMMQFVKQRMSGALSRRPDGFTILLAGIGILAAALTLARQVNAGMALPWDTVAYISTARSLLDGAGFTRFDGHPLVDFPPFYPILLAASSFGILDPYTVASPLNAVIFGLTVFGGGYYLKRRLRYSLLAVGGALALALSLPMARIASEGLSEPLFMLLALLALIQTDRLLRSGQGSALLWAALFAALAWLTRYSGIALIGVITLLLIMQPQIALLLKTRRIVSFLAIAATPMALWLLWNYAQYATTTGYRDYPIRPLPDLLNQALSVLAGWVFPPPPWGFFEYNFPWLVGGLLLAAALAVAYDCFRVWRGQPAWVVSMSFAVFAGFALAHFALVIYSASSGNSYGVFPRYLTLIYPTLALAVPLALDRLLINAQDRRRRGNSDWQLRLPQPGLAARRRSTAVSVPAIMAAAGLLLWLAWSAALNAQAIAVRNGESRAWFGLYAATRWTNSPTMQYIRQAAPPGTILSNDAAATYSHIAEPGRHRYVECTKNRLAQQVHHESLEQDVYVLWFHAVGNPRCSEQIVDYTFSDVRTIPKLATVSELEDGVVLKAEAWSDVPAAAAYALEHLAGTTIFSNITGLLQKYGPEANYRAVNPDFNAAQYFWLDDSAGDYVIWYNNPYAEPITAAALDTILELEPVAELEDSVIARINYGFRQNSETYQYIQKHLTKELIFSNAAATFIPHFSRTGFAQLPEDTVAMLYALFGDPAQDGAPIVYWYDAPDADLAQVAALTQLPGIKTAAELADGAVLSVSHEFLQTSTTLRYARVQLADASVFSNAPFVMADDSGNAQYQPLLGELSNFRWQALTMPDGAYIVWLDALSAPFYDYDADKLRQASMLRVVAELDDGVILQLDDRLGDNFRYDLYYDPARNALVYMREECPPVDPAHRFYLLLQADGRAVPDATRYLKFNLDDYGGRADGKCVATVPLDTVTEYAVSSIRTGQYLRRHWPIWRTEVPLESLPPPPAP